jgi:hypothetical protein
MTIKAFYFDCHIGVAQELCNILQATWNTSVSIEGWLISNHSTLIGRAQDRPDIINSETWFQLSSELIKQFHSRYDSYLEQFDFFLVGYPASFALLFAKYNKPIVVYNCVRYDLPFCWTHDFKSLELLNDCLLDLYSKRRLLVVSNNLADHDYFQLGCPGIPSNFIPTLGDYSNLCWAPDTDKVLVYSGGDLFNSLSDVIDRRSLGEFTSKQLSCFSAVIHIPYEVSTMSFAEHYAAGIPLFFPSLKFYEHNLDQIGARLQSRYWLHSGKAICPTRLLPAHQGEWENWWLTRADFYHEMDKVNLFDSFEDLEQMLSRTDRHTLVRLDADSRIRRRKNIIDRWRTLLFELVY